VGLIRFSIEGLIFAIVVMLCMIVAIGLLINQLWPVFLLGGLGFLWYKHEHPKHVHPKKCLDCEMEKLERENQG